METKFSIMMLNLAKWSSGWGPLCTTLPSAAAASRACCCTWQSCWRAPWWRQNFPSWCSTWQSGPQAEDHFAQGKEIYLSNRGPCWQPSSAFFNVSKVQGKYCPPYLAAAAGASQLQHIGHRLSIKYSMCRIGLKHWSRWAPCWQPSSMGSFVHHSPFTIDSAVAFNILGTGLSSSCIPSHVSLHVRCRHVAAARDGRWQGTYNARKQRTWWKKNKERNKKKQANKKKYLCGKFTRLWFNSACGI